MFLDASLILAETLTTTYSTASTSYVDTLARGETYEGAWFYCVVNTLFTVGGGAPYAKFQLQTSPATNFTDAGTVTLLASATKNAAANTAGLIYKARIPSGVRRYLRGYFQVTAPNNLILASGNDTIYFATASYDMYIVKDVDIDSSGALA